MPSLFRLTSFLPSVNLQKPHTMLDPHHFSVSRSACTVPQLDQSTPGVQILHRNIGRRRKLLHFPPRPSAPRTTTTLLKAFLYVHQYAYPVSFIPMCAGLPATTSPRRDMPPVVRRKLPISSGLFTPNDQNLTAFGQYLYLLSWCR